jgi:hypothetical protein
MNLQEQLNRIQEMMGLPNNILTEGRYSEPVRQITKDVMREVINFIEDDELDEYEWIEEYEQEEFDFDDLMEEEYYSTSFEVRLYLEKTDSETSYDLHAAHDWDDEESVDVIELKVYINPTLFTNKVINKFQAELKDTIRHEIEHLYQSENPNKRVRELPSETFAEEVLTPKELNAYIQGFYTQAKTRKMYMDDIIDEWADEREKLFTSLEEKEYVKKELTNFGKKLLPQAKWR